MVHTEKVPWTAMKYCILNLYVNNRLLSINRNDTKERKDQNIRFWCCYICAMVAEPTRRESFQTMLKNPGHQSCLKWLNNMWYFGTQEEIYFVVQINLFFFNKKTILILM